MRFSAIAVLFAGYFAFAYPLHAQSSQALSDFDGPVLEDAAEQIPFVFAQQPEPPPPTTTISQPQSAVDDDRTKEDGYRTTIKSLKQQKHQFVHCQLKNGKVLTGTIPDAGYEGFTLKTNIFGDGRYIYYKDLAQPPKPVAAAGTRLKHGAQWAGLGVVVAAAIPVLVLLSPFFFASGWQC